MLKVSSKSIRFVKQLFFFNVYSFEICRHFGVGIHAEKKFSISFVYLNRGSGAGIIGLGPIGSVEGGNSANKSAFSLPSMFECAGTQIRSTLLRFASWLKDL